METLFRHEFHPSILREYDIRGIVGETLFENDARALGVVFASLLGEHGARDILVGHDGRLSSPGLEEALTQGLVSRGMRVRRLGCCATPALYHQAYRSTVPGAIMVTGSHNPLNYNGFKLLRDNRPFCGASLHSLAAMLREGVEPVAGTGIAEFIVPDDDYQQALYFGLRPDGRPLRIVWDNASSAAGPVLAGLLRRLPGEHIILNGEVDGHFPAHHPDPTLPENMVQLRQAVLDHGADIGFGFDGDADRLGVLDERGAVVPADQLTLLWAGAILKERPGACILGDVKMSQAMFDGVTARGGVAKLCPSGHSEVKNAMKETGAVFAGEMSGHFFFADRWPGFDDGLYAALRMMDLLSHQSEPLSGLCAALPRTVATPELRFDCPDDRKFEVVDAVIALCREEGADMLLLDGVRVSEARGWWLLRASNTQPALVARAEGRDEASCQALMLRLDALLARVGIERPKENPHTSGHEKALT